MTDLNNEDGTIERIYLEYSKREDYLERKLKDLEKRRFSNVPEEGTTWIPWKLECYEDIIKMKETAINRNKTLKKQLTISMGKLRSKRCYNPAEDNLKQMIEKYSKILSDPNLQGITYMPDIKQTRPRNGMKPYKRSPTGRFWCSSFRLNNNNIVTVEGIGDIVQQIFEIPENLTWIDLSFNKLTYIHPEIAELRNLKILYLHGNHFSQFTPVLYHLQALEKLYSLTLHGNPIEEVKGYRQRVLSVLPNLKNLDFTNVTNADLECVDQMNGCNGR